MFKKPSIYETFIKEGQTPDKQINELAQKFSRPYKLKRLHVKWLKDKRHSTKPHYKFLTNRFGPSFSKRDIKECLQNIKIRDVNPDVR